MLVMQLLFASGKHQVILCSCIKVLAQLRELFKNPLIAEANKNIAVRVVIMHPLVHGNQLRLVEHAEIS